jgi:hypothetical protein
MATDEKIKKQPDSNLKRGPGNPAWKKGVSGNPQGRKKKADCLVSCIKDELAQFVAEGSKVTKEQMIATILVGKAIAGDLNAIKLTLEYTAGKPAQAVNLGDANGEPMKTNPVFIVADQETKAAAEAIAKGV